MDGMAAINCRSARRFRPAAAATPMVFALLSLAVRPLAAQDSSADVIRGRVTDDSSRAIVATIMVTRGPDRLTQQATTDSSGNFRVRFDQGTGDYLVYVSAPGFSSARRRVQRQTDEHELVANFTLARAPVATLDTIKITGKKPTSRRPAPPRNGGTESTDRSRRLSQAISMRSPARCRISR